MKSDLRNALPDPARVVESASLERDEHVSIDTRFDRFHWDGRFHPVPKGWKLPRTDVMATWRLWYFGNAAARIRPLRQLKKFDLVVGNGDVSLWTKSNGVMEAITQQMVALGLVESAEGVGRLSEDATTLAFTQAFGVHEPGEARSDEEEARAMDGDGRLHTARALDQLETALDQLETEAGARGAGGRDGGGRGIGWRQRR
jgi:hypothetical protein